MFNDHNIFSNNIHDAANRLRQIQEANVRSASDLMALGAEKGSKAEMDAKFDAIIRQGKTPSEANELGHEAHMKERLGYARRAGSRRYDLDKLTAAVHHLMQTGQHEDAASLIRVLGDANAAMGPEGKQAGSKDSRDAEELNKRFTRGEMVTPPASLSDLKLAAKIIRNKYQVPWQEEPSENS